MNFFNLPDECLIKNVIVATEIIGKIPEHVRHHFNFMKDSIKSCRIFALLNNNNFKVMNHNETDPYYKSIKFVFVEINCITDAELVAKCLLRIFNSQTVIVMKYIDLYRIATGFVKADERNKGKKIIVAETISNWINEKNKNVLSTFDINRADNTDFISVYLSLNRAIQKLNKKYLKLDFVRDLYIYVHGIEPFDYMLNNLDDTIKNMYPGNRVMNKYGVYEYLFDDDDVIDLIVRTEGYTGYSNMESLAEIIWNFINYENDFDVSIPTDLQSKIDDYNTEFWDMFENEELDESDTVDFYDWFTEERHWIEAGFIEEADEGYGFVSVEYLTEQEEKLIEKEENEVDDDY